MEKLRIWMCKEMSDEEIKNFEEDCTDYWILAVTDEKIESDQFEEEITDVKLSKQSVVKKKAQIESEHSVSVASNSLMKKLWTDISVFQDENESIIVIEPKLEAKPPKFEAGSMDGEIEEHSIEAFVNLHPLNVLYFG